MRVLFVCTGNICRSPAAERLAIAYAERASIPHLEVSSAGTRAVSGQPIHPHAVRALLERGGDPTNHHARRATARLLLSADLILTMSPSNRESVLELAPQQLNQVFTLHEAARLALHDDVLTCADLATARTRVRAHDLPQVADPIGRSAAYHSAVVNEIADILPPILELCRD